MKITLENNETHELDMTIDEVKKALLIEVEWPQIGNRYWFVDDVGRDIETTWGDSFCGHYRLSIGNCSQTREGLGAYKADMAKLAAIVAIRKHRDKTFGVFEPREDEERYYGNCWSGGWHIESRLAAVAGIIIPFATKADIERSFVECAEAWEVLK